MAILGGTQKNVTHKMFLHESDVNTFYFDNPADATLASLGISKFLGKSVIFQRKTVNNWKNAITLSML